MGLIAEKTRWIFLLASDTEPDERHIYDITNGVFTLESVGVNHCDIEIYIDGKDKSRILKFLEDGAESPFTIHNSSELFTTLQANTSKNIVIFVTGHGSHLGINNSIKPFPLINAIRTAPGIERGVIYLGQCFAGVFNFMKVGNESGFAPIVIIGATNLYNSISHDLSIPLRHGTKSWVANVFLAALFESIKQKTDIDGDGKYTVMDSYKYAGSITNIINKQRKCISFDAPSDLKRKKEEIEKKIAEKTASDPSSPDLAILNLTLIGIKTRLDSTLDVQYNHQESWVLNAFLAQDIEY